MSELLQQFHFLRPAWLLALLGLPLLLWLGARRHAAEQELSRLVDAALLPHLLHGRAPRRSVPLGLFALGWTLGALAMAGPSWDRVEQPLYVQRAAQVIAISLSQHMLSRDVAPSRLDRALYKAHALLDSNHDGLNALIGYAGDAFVVAPLTADVRSLDNLLDAMAPDTMPVDGDNAAAAIERGVELIQHAKADTGSLVLVTDQADAQALAAARKARANGVNVSVLGVGTPQGGPIPQGNEGFLHDEQGGTLMARRDDAALAALAAAGAGRYVPMSNDQSDIAALQTELHTASSPTLAAGERGDEWQDRGPWLLLPLLLIAALAFRRGWLLLVPLVLLPLLPAPAEAAGWRDWWQRPDQQAASALQAGQPAQAQQLAQDPAWRGAAAYRAGDYAAAAAALGQAGGVDAPYNLGNALAKQGQYQQAIAAYDRALQLNPQNADAKANRDAVEAALRKQQQQQKQNPSSKDDHKDAQGHGSKGQSAADANKNPGQSQQSNGDPSSSPAQASSAPGQPNAASKPGQGSADQHAGQPQSDASSQHDAAAASSPKPQTAQQQAAQQARTEQAQQALQKQMDQALAAQRGQPAGPPKPHQLGALAADDPQAKLPDDVRQTLQRVPDDPGALLRRKFDLEYRQRQGELPNPEDQP